MVEMAREVDRLVGHQTPLPSIAANTSRPAGPVAGD
jgi:hypothetical protein